MKLRLDTMTSVSRSDRLRFHLRVALSLSLFVFTAAAYAAKSIVPAELRLTKWEARCLADNVEVFLRDGHDPVTIYFDLCLDEKQLTELAQGNSRQSLPDPENLAPRATKETTGSSATLPLRIGKAMLRCLQEKARDPRFLTRDPVVLRTSSCKR